MTAAGLREIAIAVRLIAMGERDWAQNPAVIRRYENDPAGLSRRARNAALAIEGAELLDRWADKAAQRESRQ